MRVIALSLILAVAALSSGCQWICMGVNRCTDRASQEWSAGKAWRANKWMYKDIPSYGAFKAGFKAGYKFAHGGYASCEPPVPMHYWRMNGLTEADREYAQAWSDGFTHGTLVAQQLGAVGTAPYEAGTMLPPEGVPDVRYYAPPPQQFEAPANQSEVQPQTLPPLPPVPSSPMQNAQPFAPYRAPGVALQQVPPPMNPNLAPPPEGSLDPSSLWRQDPPPVDRLTSSSAVSYPGAGIGSLTNVVAPPEPPRQQSSPVPRPLQRTASPPAAPPADWEMPITP